VVDWAWHFNVEDEKEGLVDEFGQGNYDKFVKAFDELKEAWKKVGGAEDDVSANRDKLRSVQSRYEELDRMTWD